uniref:Uncharacterized protein n=1 Tax=Acrobeloides nanus TaxID=290746 RepID=A0A914DDE4_9BILA
MLQFLFSMSMKYSMLVVVVVCVCSIIIGSVQSAAVPQIANETPARAIRNMEDGGVDPNRYFIKIKKWYNSGIGQDSLNHASPFEEPQWFRQMGQFLANEKRMDDKFMADSLNLNPGRLEWNFNRL